jgi:RNA-directed DNA polymerase
MSDSIVMSNALEAEWSSIDWSEIQSKVTKLQVKIYAASQNGHKVDVVKLQKILISSFSAKLLAVKKVTQDNKGKTIAGIDGIKRLSGEQRLNLAKELQLDGESTPLKPVEILQANGRDRQLIGIPTIHDRAKQALAKMALEPEWEALFEPNSYGFRPGRSCHDAIEAIELAVRRTPKYFFRSSICVDFSNIDQDDLIGKLSTFPVLEKQMRAWLKSGILNSDVFYQTEKGKPQSSVITSLLANIVLYGLENAVSNKFPASKTRKGQAPGRFKEFSEARLIRYGNDLIVLHEKKEVIESAGVFIEEWLGRMGLKLQSDRTRIGHTLLPYQGEKPGFDFLGFNIRSFAVGKYHANKKTNGEPLLQVTKVRPSEQSVDTFVEKVKQTLERGHQMSPDQMIRRLNWLIRGWGNYFKTGSHSHEVFNDLERYQLNKIYLNWGRKKFSQRGLGYICGKIFFRSNYRVGNFGWKTGDRVELVTTLYEFSWQHHTKVQGTRSPYDGDWIYWTKRRGDHPLAPKDIKFGLHKQSGQCSHCHQMFLAEDNIEVHHIDGDRQNNRHNNKTLVHNHCHDAIHRMRGLATALA